MSSGDITAISAVVIALASLIVSVWTSMLTRRHNRLSVTPHVRVNYFHQSGQQVQVALVNSGIGPAIINRIRTFIDGRAVSSGQAPSLVDALPRVGLAGEFYAFTFSEGDALSAGEQKILVEFAVEGDSVDTGQKLRAAFARVGLIIQYESMYGDRYSVATSLLGEPFSPA